MTGLGLWRRRKLTAASQRLMPPANASLCLNPGIVAHNLFGVPIQDEDHIDSPTSVDKHFRHTPPAIRRGGLQFPGLQFPMMSYAAGFQPQIGVHQQAVQLHEAIDALWRDHLLLH